MESSISEVSMYIKKFTETKVFRFKEFVGVLVKSKATYSELFKNGEIQSTAVGEKVFINLKANVCGDILIFIGPNEQIASAGEDVMKLILTDNKIEQQKEIALKLLKQKHEGLIAVPNLISLGINILFILGTVIFTIRSIEAVFRGNNVVENIRDLWPWIFPVITFLLRKSLGSWVIKFLFKVL